MKPEVLAIVTAAARGIGGYFERKGPHLGYLSPQVWILMSVGGIVLLTIG